MSMPNKPISEDDVLIKGSSTGILIVLNLAQDYEKLIKKLVQKVKKDKKFLSETRLSIKGIDRNLDNDELGMARKMVKDKTGIELFAPDSTTPILEDIEPKSSPENKTEVYEGTLRAGDNITSVSDIIIFGDINPGASVVTKGSVFVYGKVRGTLEAGKENNTKAVVSCTGFSPIQFSIACCTLPPDLNVMDLSSTSCYLKLEGQEIKITPFKRD